MSSNEHITQYLASQWQVLEGCEKIEIAIRGENGQTNWIPLPSEGLTDLFNALYVIHSGQKEVEDNDPTILVSVEVGSQAEESAPATYAVSASRYDELVAKVREHYEGEGHAVVHVLLPDGSPHPDYEVVEVGAQPTI